MRRIFKIFMIAVGSVVIVYLGYRVKVWVDIDKCLDNGGRWNYATGECEYTDVHKK